MKAIAVTPGTTAIRLVEREKPAVKSTDEIKLRVLRVGICGTDREEAAGGRCAPPNGSNELIIGHEMFGQVIEAGSAVSKVKVGDYAVFSVRRSCGKCPACLMNRSDMCYSGDYRERGIWKLDGYQAEFAVDREQYVVRVPTEIAAVAILTEPLSVAEKAIDESLRIQASRLPDASSAADWLRGRKCLVAGLGPIGLLAAVALKLREADVYGVDIVDEKSVRPQWLEKIGGKYIDGRVLTPDRIPASIGPMDFVFEAAGVPGLAFNLIDVLALNGIYVLTGIPAGSRLLNIPGAELLRRLVLDNQVMLGSVNASPEHYRMAVDDLVRAQARWGDHIAGLITHRHVFTDFAAGLQHHGDDEIKVVLEWST
ncbi:alcohol dehydrogenase [candidate division GN15 bacterium]|uniref:Alcohol dehydrogenase n=1 Tax=candidate division GN15 bacterium TaxID=2072418 RepID=A0A855X232_9BACT|nr:MAG: alcohol dehydrogenase [candidate division GN15 bacterium]